MDDNEISRRIAYLHADLALTPQFRVEWVSAQTWDRPSFITGAGPHYPLGFSAPYLHQVEGDHGEYLVIACAEVLVDQTRDLSATDFFAYCQSVQLHLMLHMALTDQGRATEENVMAAQRAVTGHDFSTFDRIWKAAVR